MATKQTDVGTGRHSMREKAVERRKINKEHNSNFRAGYVAVDEDQLHRTGLRGRKRGLAICLLVLLFLLAIANLITTLIIWSVIRLSPEGCASMEFHDDGLLRFKQVSDMGTICPYHSAVGGRSEEDLVITGNGHPVVFKQKDSTLSIAEDKSAVSSAIGLEVIEPRTRRTVFSTDYDTHEFHLPKGVRTLHVQKASTERVTSNYTSDLLLKAKQVVVRGNEGVHISGVRVAFRVKGDLVLNPTEELILDGGVTLNPTRLPHAPTSGTPGHSLLRGPEGESYKLCVCPNGQLFRTPANARGCLVSDNPCALSG
uniref:beta-sarcoglycan isoform X1 n=1 Tax=Myxine glutinosa TaxID=7769 RepID=UPI00358F070A